VDTWNPTSFVMRHLAKKGYGEIAPALATALSWSCALAYLVVMALALPAMVLRWRDAHVALVIAIVAYYTLIHMVTFGLTRFRLPLMPLLMVLGGWFVWHVVDSRRARATTA
jgi:hypothetical protein